MFRRRKELNYHYTCLIVLTVISSIKQTVLFFLYFFNANVLWLKQKPSPFNLLYHIMHTSVKNPIIHDPCVQPISHQQSHCGGTHLSDCFPFLQSTFSFIFSKAPLYSAFCFKAATLITLAYDVSFA